jgi:hypothetical protein
MWQYDGGCVCRITRTTAGINHIAVNDAGIDSRTTGTLTMGCDGWFEGDVIRRYGESSFNYHMRLKPLRQSQISLMMKQEGTSKWEIDKVANRTEMAIGDDEAVGAYVTIAPRTVVGDGSSMSSRDKAKLVAGTKVEVLEIMTLQKEHRVRAKIKYADGEGWISLLNTETGERWAQELQADRMRIYSMSLHDNC